MAAMDDVLAAIEQAKRDAYDAGYRAAMDELRAAIRGAVNGVPVTAPETKPDAPAEPQTITEQARSVMAQYVGQTVTYGGICKRHGKTIADRMSLLAGRGDGLRRISHGSYEVL